MDKNYEYMFYKLFYKLKKNIDIELVDDSIMLVSGRFNYKKMKIFINNDGRTFRDMYTTLLHEYGHYLSYINYILKFNIDVETYGENIIKRELGAYYNGWKFIKQESIDVTKEIWRNKHKQIFDIYKEQNQISFNPFDKK